MIEFLQVLRMPTARQKRDTN